MTAILGISAFYHDSAAALVVDGKIVAAAQEERFTRIKHDHNFPQQAVDYCLAEAGLQPKDLDYVGFYDKPLLKFERLLETYLAYAPSGFRSFAMAMPLWLKQKLHLPKEMRRGLRGGYKKRFVFPEHHESHAASAFFPSPFEEAAILTLDGVGEWATASFGMGRDNRLDLTHELHFPHSLGLLYSAFTYFTGFRVNSGEYKLMGLAPYGEPKYVDLILDNLLDLKEDGSFRMDLSYFNYCQGLTMTGPKMETLFGGPARKTESALTQREMDIARSIQEVTEEIMLRTVRHVHAQTGSKNLCLAGGVALNCVGNGRILREGPFDNVWIQPAAGDAGGALGAALLIWHQLLDQPRQPQADDSQSGSRLGPAFGADAIRTSLDSVGAVYQELEPGAATYTRSAELLAESRVLGWYQGRMEFGPRALGGRSILGDPRDREMQSKMNLKIKFRESFRPFAPSVLEECSDDYFGIGAESPYMLLVGPVSEAQSLELSAEDQAAVGLDRLKVPRSLIPAVTHVDGSARVQTVDARRSPAYHGLIREFERLTGCGLVINTSFNVRGEPIVRTPDEAYHCFMATGMDALVLENFVLLKEDQPEGAAPAREEYLAQFALD
ncbi:MAG: carbamoyltransferase [Thermoanaerobaculia bacterium]|nr:carbamoyltransferase [Thermoanaerobaculia bacterium]